MKVTNFGPDGIPIALAGWSTGITSINSNAITADGGLSALNFVQRITSNGSNILLNPSVNFAAGSNIALSASSNTITITSLGGGSGTISAGSNSTNVAEISSAGTSTTLWSPYDHTHAGIATITASSSNTLQRGTFNLRAGPGIALALTDTDGDGEFDTATIVNIVTPSSIGAASAIHPMPLDGYPLDPTYGDDFNGTSLAAKWTRRNYTSAAETYQLEPTGSFMRIALTGRAAGDGYFQTAPAGDWTFMASWITRYWGASFPTWGIACINSAGTGLATGLTSTGVAAFAILGVTTYTTYSGTFAQIASDAYLGNMYAWDQRKTWVKLRKSGTNYYAAFSLNGETWSDETTAFSSAITVDRIGFMAEPQQAFVAAATIDMDLFNKIA